MSSTRALVLVAVLTGTTACMRFMLPVNEEDDRPDAGDDRTDAEPDGDDTVDAHVVDGSTGTVLRTFDVPGEGIHYGIAFDGERLWVTDSTSRAVYSLNPQTGRTLSSFTVDSEDDLSGIAWDGAAFWIATFGNVLHRYGRDGTPLDSCTLQSSRNMGMTFVGERLYFTSDDVGAAFELDVASCTATEAFPITWNDDGLAWDGATFWSADWDGQVIYRLDPDDHGIDGQVTVPGPQPAGVEWDGRALWTVSYSAQKIYQIRP